MGPHDFLICGTWSTGEDTDMADIFISYASEDRERIGPLAAVLEQAGYCVWWDQKLRGGAVYADEIEKELHRSKAVIVAWSEQSVASTWVKDEAARASTQSKLIPICLDNANLPIGFGQFHKIEFSSWNGAADAPEVRRLLESLAPLLDEAVVQRAPSASASSAARTQPTRRTGLLTSVIGLAFLAVLGGALWWVWSNPVAESRYQPASLARMAFPLPDRVSIAVLPFDNIGSDPQHGYFADGITDDLITDLSKVSELFVVARNSMFAYKGRVVAPAEVAEALGVRYVLQGSVRRAGERLRINTQLIDTTTGGSVWAERYDGSTADAFAFQDSVARSIVRELAVSLTGAEDSALGTGQTTSSEAHDAFLRGWVLYRKNTPEDLAAAVVQFEDAIRIDLEYGRAYAALAAVYQASLTRDFTAGLGEWTRSLGERPDDILAKVQRNLAAMQDSPSPLSVQVQSQLALYQGKFQDAVIEGRRAIALSENDPLGYEALAAALTLGGDPVSGREAIETAMRLDPNYPNEYLLWLGLAQFGTGAFDAAAETLESAMRLNPGDDRILIVLAAAYGHLARTDDAIPVVARLNALRRGREEDRSRSAPGNVLVGIDTFLAGPYTLKDVDLWPFQYTADRERLRDGLRLAGLPEHGPASAESPLTVAGATTVSVEEAKSLFDRGVAIVDVRAVADHSIGHISGSYFLELQNVFSEQTLLAVVSRDGPVLMHCEGIR